MAYFKALQSKKGIYLKMTTPQKKPIGIFLIHGLMGSPREYGYFEDLLIKSGYQTRAISLPGHGDLRHRPLHQFSASEMIEHCLEEYTAFAQECDHIIIIGHSLGGICTLLTASHQPEKLCGIVSLATPFEHAYSLNKTMDLFKVPPDILLRGMSYIPDQHTGFERPHFHPWMFQRLVEEGNTMLGALSERIEHIQVPVLLGHSIYDLTIPYAEMEKIEKKLSNAPKVLTHTFDRCGHQIFPSSGETENATERIISFLEDEELIRKIQL